MDGINSSVNSNDMEEASADISLPILPPEATTTTVAAATTSNSCVDSRDDEDDHQAFAAATCVTSFNCGDSLMEVGQLEDDKQTSSVGEELPDNTTAPSSHVWEVSQPSEQYLNKLDGCNLKMSAKCNESPNAAVESLPPSDIDAWLHENLADTYLTRDFSGQRNGRRKSKVRWADVESRLQNLDSKVDMSSESSCDSVSFLA